LLAGLLAGPGLTCARAAETPPASETPVAKDLVLRGDAACTRCHDESSFPNVLLIGKTPHGTIADPSSPTCTSCHGKSELHANNPEKVKPRPHPDVTFGKSSTSTPEDRSATCLACHRKDASRSHWMGSTHQSQDLSCTSCHQIHTAHDAVLDKRDQPEVCFSCHKEQRTQINKPSHHPVPEGKMSCTSCHNPHGSLGPRLMVRDNVNDTCFTCHMEKRGPFVHSHEPVTEDCTLCHNPHGTTAESMLKMRPPFLCHQCHTPHGAQVAQLVGQNQPSSMLNGTSSGKSGINYTMARGCLNCHTQVHGTNNPSTTNPTPQFNLR
jgi:DmsE family decaheme c-type cytochrome